MITKQFTLAALSASGLMLALAACSSSHGGSAQGQTHWLASCEDDGDCGDLSCLCGACVAPCGDEDVCNVAGVETECFESSSGSVRAMCTREDAVALCLQPCDGECGADQACIDGACVNEEIAQMNAAQGGEGGSSGDGSSIAGDTGGFGGASGTDATQDASIMDATARVDANLEVPQIMTPFQIGIANVTDLPVYVQTQGLCGGPPAWFTLSVDGENVNIFSGCDCSVADSEGLCPVRPPDCPSPVFRMVDPGEEFMFEWDGAQWAAPSVNGACSERLPLAADTEITLTVCWLDAAPAADPFEGPPLEDYICVTRSFVPGAELGYSIPVSFADTTE